MANKVFYKSLTGVTADIIPFFDSGHFHLFYLHDFRNTAQHGEGTPWYHLVTRDFVSFSEEGEALARGRIDEQDLFVFTGSVIKASDTFHIFYTGHNPHFPAQGKPEQAVMHAISKDLKTWQKIPEDSFFSPSNDYESNDWRDPFVFYNEQDKKFWMLLAARLKNKNPVRRGCTALCTSTDLKHWSIQKPLWSPHYHYTHECPDLFKMGEWWYLIYSEFSDKRMTRYRMAKDLNGPWLSPKDDQFDGRSYYAAKSASDGKNRYLFGWVPTKANENDAGAWQWGGNLMAHQLFQRPNGELGESIIPAIKDHFSSLEIANLPRTEVDATGRCQFIDLPYILPNSYRISVNITLDDNTTRAGIGLRHSSSKDVSYMYALDAGRQQIAFDRFPNVPWQYDNFFGVSRYLEVTSKRTYFLEILVEDDVCVCYVDNNLALSSRMYQNTDSPLALFSMDGKATFSHLKITTVAERK